VGGGARAGGRGRERGLDPVERISSGLWDGWAEATLASVLPRVGLAEIWHVFDVPTSYYK